VATWRPAALTIDAVASADGAIVAALDHRGSVAVWRLPSGERISLDGSPVPPAASLAVTSTAGCSRSAAVEGIRLWHLPSGESAGVLRGLRGAVGQLAVSADDTVLVASGFVPEPGFPRDPYGTVRIWRLPSGEPRARSGRVAKGGGPRRHRRPCWSRATGGSTRLSHLRPAGRAGSWVAATTISTVSRPWSRPPDHRILITARNKARSGVGGHLTFARFPGGAFTGMTSFGDGTVLPQALAMSPDGSLLAGVNHSSDVNAITDGYCGVGA